VDGGSIVGIVGISVSCWTSGSVGSDMGLVVGIVGTSTWGASVVGTSVGGGGSIVAAGSVGSVGIDVSKVRVGRATAASSSSIASASPGDVGSYNCGNSVGEDGAAVLVEGPGALGRAEDVGCIPSSSSPGDVGEGCCVGTGNSVGDCSVRAVGASLRLRIGGGMSGMSVGDVGAPLSRCL